MYTFCSALQFHGEKIDHNLKNRKSIREISESGIFFLYPIGAILKTMKAFRFFHKIFTKLFLTLLKTKFPQAHHAMDAITHYYNYTRQLSKNYKIWPLFLVITSIFISR